MTNHLAAALGIGRTDRHDRRFATMPDGRYYRYADVDGVSARFARAVQALGVQPGDRVAVQVEKSIEALMLYLGVVRAGAVFLPLNTAYTPAEIGYFVGDAEPTLLVADPSRAEALAAVAGGVRIETMGVWAAENPDPGSLFSHVPEAPGDFADVARGPDDLAAILYTSGTTGRSKGAMLSHENLASNARVLAAYWRFTADDVLIHALPIFHTHGLFVATNTTLVAGLLDALPAPLRCGCRARRAAGGERADGRSHLLHPPSRRPAARRCAHGRELRVEGYSFRQIGDLAPYLGWIVSDALTLHQQISTGVR